MKYINLIYITFIVIVSCGQFQNKHQKETTVDRARKDTCLYFPCLIKTAWANKDGAKVKELILTLNDTINVNIFYSNLSDISDVTHFYFGNADLTEKRFWSENTTEEINIMMKNISIAFKLYINSCLFLKEIEYDRTENIQKKFFTKTHVYSNDEIKLIEAEINNLCDN